MHDFFQLRDLSDETQRRLLSRWLEVVHRDRTVPLTSFLPSGGSVDLGPDFILLCLSSGNVRAASVIDAGPMVARNLGRQPNGLLLEELTPVSYLADIIPAYALCAGLFVPLSSLDEVSFSDRSHRLVRRLILPLSRQPAGSAHAAGQLLVLFAPEGEAETEPLLPGQCRTMTGVCSQGAALFREGSSP